MDTTCHGGYCAKCWGGKWILAGVVLYIATWYAKSNNNIWFVWYTLAVLAVLKGIMKLVKPCCPDCEPSMPMKKGKK